MIRVTLPVLVLLYLALLLATVLGAWLLYGWNRHRGERHAFRNVLRCTRCGFEFEDQKPKPLAACPRCGGLNERTRLSRL